jgi:hypothetical protein
MRFMTSSRPDQIFFKSLKTDTIPALRKKSCGPGQNNSKRIRCSLLSAHTFLGCERCPSKVLRLSEQIRTEKRRIETEENRREQIKCVIHRTIFTVHGKIEKKSCLSESCTCRQI